MNEKFSPFNISDYLDSDEVIAEYLAAAAENENQDVFLSAIAEVAKARGMAQLKGHRSVGGMRASIYNAMPRAGVEALVEYMKEFAAQKG